jgi:hypothetical protein
MLGPLANLTVALLGEMTARNDTSMSIDDAKRGRILRGLSIRLVRLVMCNSLAGGGA